MIASLKDLKWESPVKILALICFATSNISASASPKFGIFFLISAWANPESFATFGVILIAGLLTYIAFFK